MNMIIILKGIKWNMKNIKQEMSKKYSLKIKFQKEKYGFSLMK